MKQDGFRLNFTALWFIFAPVLGCMLLAAINYSNNLVYAILYLVGSLSFISVFHTWRNLASLNVEHIRIQPAFAGEEVRVEIYLRNPSKQTIYGLSFARLSDDNRRPVFLRRPGGGNVRIAAGDSCAAEVLFPAERRGVYRFESLLVRTPYPFGLFWASFRTPGRRRVLHLSATKRKTGLARTLSQR